MQIALPLISQAKQLPLAQNIDEADHKAGPLREHGGQSRTPDAPVKNAHQENIQGDVAPGGDRHAIKGLLGVTHRPEHGRQGIVAKNEHQTQRAQPQILGGLPQSRGLQRQQNRPAAQNHHQGHNHPGGDCEGKEGAVGLLPVGMVATSKILTHEDIAAGGDAHNNLGENHHHLPGVVDGGDAVLADKPPGHNQVRNGIGRLKQGGEHHRQSIDNQLFPNDAFREIHLSLCQSVRLLPLVSLVDKRSIPQFPLV